MKTVMLVGIAMTLVGCNTGEIDSLRKELDSTKTELQAEKSARALEKIKNETLDTAQDKFNQCLNHAESDHKNAWRRACILDYPWKTDCNSLDTGSIGLPVSVADLLDKRFDSWKNSCEVQYQHDLKTIGCRE
jgi:hypothetical protein